MPPAKSSADNGQSAASSVPSVYLAGPEVFRLDAREEGERLKRLCAEQGVVGLYPLDQTSDDIRSSCIALIHRADAIVANISPFRGPHMDPGTAFELGYGEALGLPLFLWSSEGRDLAGRIPAARSEGGLRDAQGLLIEDFGKPENLMIVRDGARVHASPEEAIAAAAAFLAPAKERGVAMVRHQAIHRSARFMVLAAFVISLGVALGAGLLVNRLVGW